MNTLREACQTGKPVWVALNYIRCFRLGRIPFQDLTFGQLINGSLHSRIDWYLSVVSYHIAYSRPCSELILSQLKKNRCAVNNSVAKRLRKFLKAVSFTCLL